MLAERNHVASLFSLGKMLQDGRGTTKSESEARQIFRLAAKLGSQEAELALNSIGDDDAS